VEQTIVGISGFAGVGKDKAAEALVKHGYTRIAFADVLRDIAIAIDPYVELWGDIEGEPWYDNTDFYRLGYVINAIGWDKAKNEHPDVRRLLQRLGTEAGRDILGENIWVDTAFGRTDADKIVVTDVRFPNEAEGIRARGGVVVRLHRPGVGPRNDHPSELALVDYPFDYHIDNDGTIEDLHNEVQRLLT